MPPVIDGPVLISAGDWTGFERGSNVLNPYRGFQKLKPVTSIQDGVLVYEGRFAVPLASAMSHVQQSELLLKQKNVDGALAEAQQAVAIAPDDLEPQIAFGDALAGGWTRRRGAGGVCARDEDCEDDGAGGAGGLGSAGAEEDGAVRERASRAL